MKQTAKVFVPEYPGKKVFPKYHGIPSEQYLQKTKEGLEQFIRENNCKMSIETARQGKVPSVLDKPVVNIVDNNLEISTGNLKFSIKPTKWGTDQVSLLHNRIWLFDGNTLDDFNLTCQ